MHIARICHTWWAIPAGIWQATRQQSPPQAGFVVFGPSEGSVVAVMPKDYLAGRVI
jgi:hypothetical protein